MRHLLLFDGNCAACSRAAQEVTSAGIPSLEVKPLRDPEVAELLGRAGLVVPGRPALLWTENGKVRLAVGWRMRLRLARLVGWRRAGAIVQLLAVEARARSTKDADAGALSRRRILGGSAAAAVAGALGWSVGARPAHAAAQSETPHLVPAAGADVQRAMGSERLRAAIRTWGPVRTDVTEVRSGDRRVLAFQHQNVDVMTFVDNSAIAKKERPTTLSIRQVDEGRPALRFYTAEGFPLCDLRAESGQVSVTPVPPGTPTPVGPLAAPPAHEIACFIGCLGGGVSEGCITACFLCVAAQPAQCIVCYLCAGPAATRCADECFG